MTSLAATSNPSVFAPAGAPFEIEFGAVPAPDHIVVRQENSKFKLQCSSGMNTLPLSTMTPLTVRELPLTATALCGELKITMSLKVPPMLRTSKGAGLVTPPLPPKPS